MQIREGSKKLIVESSCFTWTLEVQNWISSTFNHPQPRNVLILEALQSNREKRPWVSSGRVVGALLLHVQRRDEVELRGCQFDEATNLCSTCHTGPVKKGNGETFARSRKFRSLAEDLGHTSLMTLPMRYQGNWDKRIPSPTPFPSDQGSGFLPSRETIYFEYIRADDGQSTS